mmetsp:Transcript_34352/g.70234  ORF Transcript_34352/g.70234 Transcript_34352/m.70234 type:complete len:242 (+) Transcript_34352:74-799(+)|eukprot:CAMPEP_0171695248 /NCGR_PEP_ID=MMETSP0991-20121206/7661_1 /TAXON_ID=483369 /ORGANISM="non described non described, Strain CCMP2098" /LENGTH=241 /DNA_ID=CAMNT_0012283911 /DNA_START=25 /DNA_END=750 /DNA_ORIENTATION=-
MDGVNLEETNRDPLARDEESSNLRVGVASCERNFFSLPPASALSEPGAADAMVRSDARTLGFQCSSRACYDATTVPETPLRRAKKRPAPPSPRPRARASALDWEYVFGPSFLSSCNDTTIQRSNIRCGATWQGDYDCDVAEIHSVVTAFLAVGAWNDLRNDQTGMPSVEELHRAAKTLRLFVPSASLASSRPQSTINGGPSNPPSPTIPIRRGEERSEQSFGSFFPHRAADAEIDYRAISA